MKMKKKNNNSHTIIYSLLKYHAIGAIFICGIVLVLYLLCDKSLSILFDRLETVGGFSFLGVLDIQISVTFLVISIVTVFAQRNITVYWEDILQYKLVRPLYTNFIAMATYIFVDLLFSILLILWGSKYVYVTFFLAILLISLLSIKMICAYFSRDMMRNELEKVFEKEKNRRLVDTNARKSYREHKRKLIQYTLQAIELNEIDLVCTNISMLYRFNEDDDTSYLVRKTVQQDRIFLLSRIAKECQFIFACEAHVQEFDQICRELLEKDGKESCGYIQSIYKSIGEYVTENKMEQIDALRQVIEAFCEYSVSKGNTKLADSILETFEKQLSR